MDFNCLICSSNSVILENKFQTLCRVTSDCKPWKKGGEIGVCQFCGAVQKTINEKWKNEVQEIYEKYENYQLSDGDEQVVFDGVSGASMSRSAKLIKCLQTELLISLQGKLLDVGCGNGAWLKAFSQYYPKWTLAGTEWDNKNKAIVEAIEGVEELYTCSPEFVPGDFDIITMIHVLEHIYDPRQFLCSVRNKLANEGILIIEVPNYLQNSFDFLIADHCMHYTEEMLKKLLSVSGYQVVFSSTNCIDKEITIVAKKLSLPIQEKSTFFSSSNSIKSINEEIDWLVGARNEAKKYCNEDNFGIFGTGIAATWIYEELNGQINFFVDENPSRIGKTYMGKPVYGPNDLATNSHIFIALPPKIAALIKERIGKEMHNINYLVYRE